MSRLAESEATQYWMRETGGWSATLSEWSLALDAPFVLAWCDRASLKERSQRLGPPLDYPR